MRSWPGRAAMADDFLVLLLDGQTIGVIRRRQGRLSLIYDEARRRRADAYPLSLSMPITAAEHAHGPVNAFLWGLLPDNEVVIGHWARHLQVSPRTLSPSSERSGRTAPEPRSSRRAV